MPEGAARRGRFLLLTNTSRRDTTGRLMAALAERLGRRGEAALIELRLPSGIRRKLARAVLPRLAIWRAVLRADVLMIHTSVVFSAAYALAARLMGKRLVVFFWDLYPEPLIESGFVRDGPAIRSMGWVERRVVGLAHAVFVPTADYLRAPQVARLPRAGVLAMWPYLPAERLPAPPEGAALRIGFAGAINPIRDLEGALRALGRAAEGPVEVSVWSPDPFRPEGLPANVKVDHRGYVGQDELTRALAGMDAGLVCLDPGFRWPSFPSKIFSYVCAGLPVVFRGPPAPALRGLLRDTGVGIALDPDTRAIGPALREMRAGFGPRQAAFLAQAALDDAALDRVLGQSQS